MSISDRSRPDATPYPYIIRCRFPGNPATKEWGYETREQADRQRQGITRMFQSAGQTATITLLTPNDVQHFRVGPKHTSSMPPTVTPRRNRSAAQPGSPASASATGTGTRWSAGKVIAATLGVLAGVIIVASAISTADDDAPSTARDVPSASTGIDDADEPPLTDEDGSVGDSKPPLALDLAWLSVTNADRREMCSRYQADPDEAVSALLNGIENSDNSIFPAQAHELFSTNCT